MIVAYLTWWLQTIGYWIRPYDMLADRRRWRWQPRQRCGGVIYLPEETTRLMVQGYYDVPADPDPERNYGAPW